MQKTTTLKDFKVFALKTLLVMFVLGLSFKGSFGQDLRTKKFGNPAKPTAVDAKPVVVQKAVTPMTDAQGIALKQQMMAQGYGRTGTRPAVTAKAVTPESRQSDNPAYKPQPSVQKVTNPA